jgi:hypothetical protein
MLVPWARAEVFRTRHRLPMLAPRWVLPRLGPLLRRERDTRFYAGQFSPRGYVRGARKWLALARGHTVDECRGEELASSGFGNGVTVVRFDSYLPWFRGLLAYREHVARRLREILSARASAMAGQTPEGLVVGVHIRRGDMRVMRPGQRFDEKEWAWSMPEEWYLGAIRRVRAIAGGDVPVVLFSDATDEQLAPFLRLPEVRRAPRAPAVVDLIRMSRARVLITTGTSSFSTWGVFLGGMPSVWYPGLHGRWLREDGEQEPGGLGAMFETDYNGDFDPGDRFPAL